MDEVRLYVASIISVPFFQRISVCHSTMTVTATVAVVSGSQSDSKLVCFGRLFLFCRELVFRSRL